MKKLYNELDGVQFKPDYVCLIIDENKDYHRARRGFSINGISYKRLLGTNGGIKNSTIVFVSERLSKELHLRIDNDRDLTKEQVTAKLESYKALTCSASTPVSFPNGILIVNDAETKFLSDIVYITDEESGEPIIEQRYGSPITLNASDGFGLISPRLAKRWSNELELDYVFSGANTRFAFEKGMVGVFDFVAFGEKIAKNYIVKDAWGDEVDIRNVELVLTTSMVKLWDSYESCEDYLNKSIKNGYTFGIAKVCPKALESERCLNYQFIQSYEFSDDDIEELITPTINEIKDVLGGDWRKTILFLKGAGLNENNIEKIPNDYIKSIMIDRRMLDDPFIQNNIYQLIRNRINEAKVGVIKVHGNYSIAFGDPYLLCQHIFNLEETGLLKAGEIYNKYWVDHEANKLACFRAPMSCHNNIRLLKPVANSDIEYWYQYMTTCTIFNAWDTSMIALNGMDFDGDLVMLTDNNVLVDKIKSTPALMCAQRRAPKTIPGEDDFVRSNISSFGNEIGQTTNWITSMFEVRAGFPSDSKEYDELTYRIQCGQLYQQNSIDKAKGIICKPMPKEWHDRHIINKIEDQEKKEMYRRIVADKKPYFMIYIYPSLKKTYNTYIKSTNKKSLREFQMTVEEMMRLSYNNLTDNQKEFLRHYNYYMPVGTNDCVMNKICRRFEQEFDSCVATHNISTGFDYTIMRSDYDYTAKQFNALKRLYREYNNKLVNYSIFVDCEKIDEYTSSMMFDVMNEEFRKECRRICPNQFSLCNIILDICYTKKSTKRFAWSMCGDEIIANLLSHNDNKISFPTIDEYGSLHFNDNNFKIVSKRIEVTQ